MITDILLYTLFFGGFAIISGLLLAIFISVFFRSKTKSIVPLIIFILLSIYNINTGFNFSNILGVGMIIILVILSILAVIMIRRRQVNEEQLS